MKKWFYALNGQQQGPVDEQELRQLESRGTIQSPTLVWCAEMPAWIALGAVPANLLPPALREAPALPIGYAAPRDQSTPSVGPGFPAVASGPEQTHQFEFHGKAGEFFRIWIVNVVLTVITLGIYAAWAKVRTLRYFYGNTRLDGKPFDFTGNPISILKGNLLFGGLFVLYVVAGAILPALAIVVMLVIFALSPWLIQKALRFRAHNTVHRNVRCNFRGTVSESYTVFMWLNILIVFTLGLIIPYLHFRQKKYYFGNLGWGDCQASMNGKPGFFYRKAAPLLVLAALFLIAMTAAIALPAFQSIQKRAQEAGKNAGQSRQLSNFSSSPVSAQSDFEKRVREKMQKRIEEHIAQNPNMSEEEKQRLRDTANSADSASLGVAEGVGVALGMGIYFFMFIAFLVYRTRTANYSLNVTQWGNLGHLESSVRVRDMLWLFFSNGLAVVCSLGLLIPWVKIRMARYRATKTKLIAAGSLDTVAQSIGTGESAMGDAGADIFDFDIGF